MLFSYYEIMLLKLGGNFIGDLVNVVIPRPSPNGDQVQGLGKVIHPSSIVLYIYIYYFSCAQVNHLAKSLNDRCMENSWIL